MHLLQISYIKNLKIQIIFMIVNVRKDVGTALKKCSIIRVLSNESRI